jgi:hypothetical protein
MARKPLPTGGGFDPFLHVVDQHGCHWKVSRNTSAQWQLDLEAVVEPIGGGPRSISHHPVQASAFVSLPGPTFGGPSQPNIFGARSWVPEDWDDVVYERAASPRYFVNNWGQQLSLKNTFSGFLLHPLGGATIGDYQHVLADGSTRTMWWSVVLQWGNFIEGIRSYSGTIDGVWTSTQPPPTGHVGATADRLTHFDLKSFVHYLPVMTQQSMQLVELPGGAVAMVLGCAGGRVRIVTSQGFQPPGGSQVLGSLSSMPLDVGFGVAGLQARFDPIGSKIVVWFGSTYSPPALPAQYGAATTGSIGSMAMSEVAAGAVHRVEWSLSTGTWSTPTTVVLTPSATQRGAGPVGGIVLADVNSDQVEELVVACMTGDVIVFDRTTMVEIGRTHFGGAVGHYNSLIVADIGGGDAIYAAGSLGLRRLTP